MSKYIDPRNSVWAVYYDYEHDDIEVLEVLYFKPIETNNNQRGFVPPLPIVETHNSRALKRIAKPENLLGYSDIRSPKRQDYELEIQEYNYG